MKNSEDFIIVDDNQNLTQIITLDSVIYNIFKQLEQINKNLEKIANKDFIQIGDLHRR